MQRALDMLQGAVRRSASSVYWVLVLTMPVLMLALMAWHWASIDAGSDALAGADREWLTLAALAAAATWVAAASCRLGSITIRLPLHRVVAVQFAGSCANHVLPGGVGAASLNVRMLRRAGLSGPDAAGAVGLSAAAGAVVHLGALIVMLTLIPRPHPLAPPTRAALLVAALGVLAALAVLAYRTPADGGRGPTVLRAALEQARLVLRRPRRAALLWTGSAAVPVLHVLALLAVLRSLDLPQPVTSTALAYLGASAIAALVPSPGGFGSLDVALVAALAALGTPASHAIAAVLAYRLLTVWLPLLPGAATVAVLAHRRII